MKCRECDGHGYTLMTCTETTVAGHTIQGRTKVECSVCEGQGDLCGHSRPPEFCWECWKAKAEEQRYEHARTLEVRHDAEGRLERARGELNACGQALVDMLLQHCHCENGVFDSASLSANAEAMRVLARFGVMEITKEIGRRVFAKWAHDAELEERMNVANTILDPDKYVEPNTQTEEPF